MRKTLEVRTRARRFKARELPRTGAGHVQTVGRGHPDPFTFAWRTCGRLTVRYRPPRGSSFLKEHVDEALYFLELRRSAYLCEQLG
jgi:hypothetical protein